jgi:hypothetical protein
MQGTLQHLAIGLMCTTPSVSVAQKSISFPLCFLDGFYVAVQQAWFSNFSRGGKIGGPTITHWMKQLLDVCIFSITLMCILHEVVCRWDFHKCLAVLTCSVQMKVAYGEHDELELHSCPWIHQWTLLAVEIGVLQVIFELGWPYSLPKNGVTWLKAAESLEHF